MSHSGLICRIDSSQEPVITLAPPLISGLAEFEEITAILRQGLKGAWHHLRRGSFRSRTRHTEHAGRLICSAARASASATENRRSFPAEVGH